MAIPGYGQSYTAGPSNWMYAFWFWLCLAYRLGMVVFFWVCDFLKGAMRDA
jgi:hypothetical protein